MQGPCLQGDWHRNLAIAKPAMIKLAVMTLVLLFSLLPGNRPVVFAQAANDVRWQAEYWNNATLAGAPQITQTETAINYNWGTGSPAPGLIGAERFSARWTGTAQLEAGRYRFTITVDDGARLWVNNQLLIDEWTVQARQVYAADLTLAGGATPIRLEYFENTGQAEIRLTWTRLDTAPPPPTAAGAPINVWRGEYFNNITLAGTPALVRNDERLDFNWGSGSPAPGVIGADRFAVRWTRTLTLSPGRYQFAATVDDGVRLWVDGRQVLNDWRVQSVRTLQAVVELTGGATPVQLDYFENTGEAVARLTWTQLSADSAPPFPPSDDLPAGQTATVARASQLNLRTGPGVNFARVSVLNNGDVIELLGRNARTTWIQVRLADGRSGWVNSAYLNTAATLRALPVTR